MSPAPGRRRRVVVRRTHPELSLRFDRRVLAALALTSLAAAGAFGLTIVEARYKLSLGQVVPTLLGHGDHTAVAFLRDIWMPRALAALLVGAALGMSGAIFQALAGNPLVSPDIIGINHGASVLVVGAVVLAHSTAPPFVFCLGGATVTALVVYGLSVGSGLSGARMVLIGLGVNAFLGALITYLMTLAERQQLAGLITYLLGDLSTAGWSSVRALAAPSIVLLAIGTALGSRLEVLQLGDAVAAGVGANVFWSRTALLAVGVGLAAICVSAVGPVAFVAFIAPHIARRLARSSGAGVLPLAAAVGAALVVVADFTAQHVTQSSTFPVGIVTVLIGGPYFMYVLWQASRAGFVA